MRTSFSKANTTIIINSAFTLVFVLSILSALVSYNNTRENFYAVSTSDTITMTPWNPTGSKTPNTYPATTHDTNPVVTIAPDTSSTPPPKPPTPIAPDTSSTPPQKLPTPIAPTPSPPTPTPSPSTTTIINVDETSQSDTNSSKSSKKYILYAIIAVVVAIIILLGVMYFYVKSPGSGMDYNSNSYLAY
jgi:uncharacterized membrane protein